MMSSESEVDEMPECDSFQPEPMDSAVKTEEEEEEIVTPDEVAEETNHDNDPSSVAMADGTIVNDPSELEILHALDQKINRLERMTVGIFEIIRHLGVQVHGVSNHLSNVESKFDHILQGNTCSAKGMPIGQASIQSVNYNNTQSSVTSSGGITPTLSAGFNPNPQFPMSDVASIPTDCSTRRLSWNERFEELKRYKEANGHCDVPQIYDTGLGTWVSAQRSQFKRYIVGKTSSMTHPRKSCLDQIGFSWSLRKRFSWNERFSELRNYSETHNGSCDVTNDGDYKALWTWCQNQKQAYKRGREGKSQPVPAERVTLMEQIGFRWSTASAESAIYLPLSTPTEESGSPMSDSDDVCSEIGEL
jgi:hypothetical protein